jgi:hypothetical protein
MAISALKQKRTELNTFFSEWIELILPGMNTYYMGQNAPRPELPYIAYQPIASIDTIGFDERRVDDQGNETLRGQRVISCEMIAVSDATSRWDGTDDAWSILQELRFSFDYSEVIDLLTAIACRVLDQGTVSDISQNLNTTTESRAALSFTLSTALIQSIDSGEIASINVEGTASVSFGTKTVSVSVEKP